MTRVSQARRDILITSTLESLQFGVESWAHNSSVTLPHFTICSEDVVAPMSNKSNSNFLNRRRLVSN